ncbi:hypothetical protein J120_03815 [candidate division TM6 bacterium JCVI TM6SC1]|uniref:Uncharacterized protein n=1 Tax=candidate division TM6 bacterium JCVI TM6SC1 TaxID=1306947 RepID=A0A0D2K439_9BACT|nr:hypothetical protein J120_03815 [candidate division TM6 bacterium JCVI TM6SC1]
MKYLLYFFLMAINMFIGYSGLYSIQSINQYVDALKDVEFLMSPALATQIYELDIKKLRFNAQNLRVNAHAMEIADIYNAQTPAQLRDAAQRFDRLANALERMKLPTKPFKYSFSYLPEYVDIKMQELQLLVRQLDEISTQKHDNKKLVEILASLKVYILDMIHSIESVSDKKSLPSCVKQYIKDDNIESEDNVPTSSAETTTDIRLTLENIIQDIIRASSVENKD